MKSRKSRRGVSTIIAVLLMIIITVAAAVIVWAFLSGYIGARTAPTTQTSMIQINAAR
jgi:flagellin-like protein